MVPAAREAAFANLSVLISEDYAIVLRREMGQNKAAVRLACAALVVNEFVEKQCGEAGT
jgi:hypothetical protein